MYKSFDVNNGIKGVGTDMCDIRRFEKMQFEIREKLAAKILTEEELAEYLVSKNKSKTLAVYFCVKECVAKTLCTGFYGIAFKDIMLRNNALGKPMIYLSAKAAEIASKADITTIKISITHEDHFVISFAVAD